MPINVPTWAATLITEQAQKQQLNDQVTQNRTLLDNILEDTWWSVSFLQEVVKKRRDMQFDFVKITNFYLTTRIFLTKLINNWANSTRLTLNDFTITEDNKATIQGRLEYTYGVKEETGE